MIVFQRRTTRILDKKNGRKSLSSNLSHFLRLNGACLRCLLSKFRNFKVSSSTVGWIYWNALERDHGFVWESIFLKKLIFRSRRSAYPLSAAGKQKLNRPGGIKVGFCRDTWSIARMIERSTRILNAGDSWDAARERERERAGSTCFTRNIFVSLWNSCDARGGGYCNWWHATVFTIRLAIYNGKKKRDVEWRESCGTIIKLHESIRNCIEWFMKIHLCPPLNRIIYQLEIRSGHSFK